MTTLTHTNNSERRIPTAGWIALISGLVVLIFGLVFRREVEERELQRVMKISLISVPILAVAVWVSLSAFLEERAERARTGTQESALATAKRIGLGVFVLFLFPFMLLGPLIFADGQLKPIHIGMLAVFALVGQMVLPRLYLRSGLEDCLPGEALDARVQSLSKKAGINLGSTLVIPADEEDVEPLLNAAVHGIGRSRQMILSADLISALDADQLDAIIAHELGHLRESHLVLQIIALAVGQWVLHSLNSAESVVGNVAVVIWILAFLPAHYGLSRWCEYRADKLAADWTSPVAAAEALRIITEDHKRPGWFRRLLSTHPEPADRIERLLKMS